MQKDHNDADSEQFHGPAIASPPKNGDNNRLLDVRDCPFCAALLSLPAILHEAIYSLAQAALASL